MKRAWVTMAVLAVVGLLAASAYAVDLKPVPCGKTSAYGSRSEVIRPGNPQTLFNGDYLVDIPDGTIRPAIDGILSPGEWSIDAQQIDISDTEGQTDEPDPPGTVTMWIKHYPYTYGTTMYDAIWVAVENTADHQTGPTSYDQVGFYVDDNKDEQWSPCFGGADGQSMEGNFWSVRAHQDTLMFREIRWPCNPCDTSWLLISDSTWSHVGMTGGNVTFEFIVLYGDLYWMLNVAKDFPKGLWAFCLNDTSQGAGDGYWNGWYPQVCVGMCDQENFATLDPPPVMVTVTDDYQDYLGVPGIVPDNKATIDFEGSYTNTSVTSRSVYRWVDVYRRRSDGCDGSLLRTLELKPNPFTLSAGETKTFTYALGPVPDNKQGLQVRVYHRVGTTLYTTESEMFFDEDIVEKDKMGNVPLSVDEPGPTSWRVFGLMEGVEVPNW